MKKEPLYRKENTRALNYRHNVPGGEFRYERHTKKMQNFEGHKKSMKKKDRGLDYTPLFKFLLSKVGENWDKVYSEAVSRLDKQEPIFWMVAIHEDNKKNVVRIGENSQYSGLYVDNENLLQLVDPDITINDIYPSCSCCTYSFNGVPLTNKPKNLYV